MSYIIHILHYNPLCLPRVSHYIEYFGGEGEGCFKAFNYQIVLGEWVCNEEIGRCPRVIWRAGIQNAKPPFKM